MLAIPFLFLAYQASSSQCLTISFEGGGAHGAYEAGALYTLVNTLPASEVAYDIISGISTGAINTGFSIQYPVGQEKDMASYVVDTWLGIGGQSNVFVQWPGGYIEGLLFKSSLYDTSPLRKLITSKTAGGIKRRFSIGSTSLNTGSFKNYNESIGTAGLTDAIMSSSAVPVLFPFILMQGDVMSDGAILINLDVFEAVNRCAELGFAQSDTVVDLLFDSKVSSVPSSFVFNTLGVFQRVKQIKDYRNSIWYYHEALLAYPDAHFRYVVIPTRDLPGGPIPLNFTQSAIEETIQMGKDDAQKVLSSGVSGREVLLEAYNQIKAIVIP